MNILRALKVDRVYAKGAHIEITTAVNVDIMAIRWVHGWLEWESDRQKKGHVSFFFFS